METLHRLAGVRDPSELTSDHDRPQPPIPDTDSRSQYAGSEYSVSRRLSRASIPLSTKKSHLSIQSGKGKKKVESSVGAGHGNETATSEPVGTTTPSNVEEKAFSRPNTDHEARRSHSAVQQTHDGAPADEAPGAEDDFEWGPSHPCFPLPNPHCSPDSDEFRATRVIRVRRDWLSSGDLYPQYANLYPETLDPLLTDEEFRFVISNLNSRLKDTFDPFQPRSWLDAVAGLLTGFLWDDLGLSGPKAKVKKLEHWVDKWNQEKEEAGKEVRMIQLRTTGFMSLDFVIPDPGLDVVVDDEVKERDVRSAG